MAKYNHDLTTYFFLNHDFMGEKKFLLHKHTTYLDVSYELEYQKKQ